MSPKCAFPDHHSSAGDGGALVPIVVLAVLGLVAYHFRHILEIAAIIVAVAALMVLAWRCRRHLRAVWGTLAMTVWFIRLACRFPRASSAVKRNYPAVIMAHVRWRWVCRSLALGRPDPHHADRKADGRTTVRPRLLHPAARIHADAHGLVASVKTVPKVGREEFEDAAPHLANAWRCQRVSVSQPKPGRLIVRGFKADPLLTPLGIGAAPRDLSVRHLWLGRDEHGDDRYADLANCPGIVVGGMPGAGKSVTLTSWLAQLAPRPGVQLVTVDGKGSGEFDDFAPRAWITEGDDLDRILGVLETLHDLMTARLAVVRAVLGHKNAWHVGPTVDWPLVVAFLDECQMFLDLTAAKGDKEREPKVRRCIFLVSALVRKGRSAMMLTIAATQKPTTDSLPSSIRDNCPIKMCFGVDTIDAAVAALGSDIRCYESYSPVTLADPAYAGCATVKLKTGQDPFTRLRGPWVSEDQAAEVAETHASLRCPPVLPVAVPDDARELLSAEGDL